METGVVGLEQRYRLLIEEELRLPYAGGGVHLDPARAADPEAGVLLFKPGVMVAPGALSEIASRFTAVGCRPSRARVVPAAEVRRSSAVAAHYRAHWARADASWITPGEAARLVAVHGELDASIPVRGAWRHLAATGVGVDDFADWVDQTAERHGVKNGDPRCTNTLSDVCDVQLVPDAALGGPAFVLNPQMVSLARQWSAVEEPTIALLLCAADPAEAWSWGDVRTNVLGVGSSATWPAGSFRGDFHDGVLPLRHSDSGAAPSTARSGVHLSNGPVEAMCEAGLWAAVAPDNTTLGATLRSMGVNPMTVVDRPFLQDGRETVALVEVTAGMDIDAAAALIVGNVDRLCSAPLDP